MNYFEDVVVGRWIESEETYTLTKEEIISFCSEWDPLPFHVDEELARQSPMGKLFTSAVHVVAIAVRLGHSMQREPSAVIAGLGWDEVRFLLPVCAGDQIKLRATVESKRESASKPDRGIVTSHLVLVNQHGQDVASYKMSTLLQRRPQ